VTSSPSDPDRTQAAPIGGVDTAAWTPPDLGPSGAAGDPPVAGVPVAGDDATTAAARILPGTVGEDRYRVTGQLGVGGMGVVVRAHDEVLDREVAIKLLADNLALDDGSRSRFLHEARAAAAVTDPRVVTVYDVGEQGGRPYLVMELVDGPSLAEVLADDGPLDPGELVQVASDALGALGAAHDAGLLHRDVKPGNLLRAADGTVKVTDFGVAVAVDAERLTRTGFVIGTAGYLAPERRRGEDATVRTDLWALGATLTELLTGHAPGDEATEALAGRDGVPVRLRDLLRRLLAEHPDDRPPDAIAALALLALDPARSGAPTPPPPRRSRTRLLPAEAGRPPSGDRAATPPPVPRRGPVAVPGPRPWSRLVVLAALLATGVLTVLTVGSGRGTDDATDPQETFGPVVVDPDDPSGTVRDLADELRERAGR
jgi:hypothetical protein